MLAPRRTLHSTPLPVFLTALREVNAQSHDVLYDVGCGDGRCVVAAAEHVGLRAVGVEIESARAQEARKAAKEHGVEHLVTIVEGNALEVGMEDATIVFLFLIEHGLRLMKRVLETHRTPCRVVTYLYRIPDVKPLRKVFVRTKEDGSADVAFPIFIYEFPLAPTPAPDPTAIHPGDPDPEESTR